MGCDALEPQLGKVCFWPQRVERQSPFCPSTERNNLFSAKSTGIESTMLPLTISLLHSEAQIAGCLQVWRSERPKGQPTQMNSLAYGEIKLNHPV